MCTENKLFGASSKLIDFLFIVICDQLIGNRTAAVYRCIRFHPIPAWNCLAKSNRLRSDLQRSMHINEEMILLQLEMGSVDGDQS